MEYCTRPTTKPAQRATASFMACCTKLFLASLAVTKVHAGLNFGKQPGSPVGDCAGLSHMHHACVVHCAGHENPQYPGHLHPASFGTSVFLGPTRHADPTHVSQLTHPKCATSAKHCQRGRLGFAEHCAGRGGGVSTGVMSSRRITAVAAVVACAAHEHATSTLKARAKRMARARARHGGRLFGVCSSHIGSFV